MIDPSEQSPQSTETLSANAQSILGEMARLYILTHPEPGTIHEIAPPDLMTFKIKARALWLRYIGPDTQQFNADFKAIKALIEERGAETIIAEENQRQEASRSIPRAPHPTERIELKETATDIPLAQPDTQSRHLGSGVLKRLVRRTSEKNKN